MIKFPKNDIYQDALGTGVSFFTDENDKNIHPFQYIESMQNPDCTKALLRFAEHIDMKKIEQFIEEIPENIDEIFVITDAQKKYYKAVFHMMLEKGL